MGCLRQSALAVRAAVIFFFAAMFIPAVGQAALITNVWNGGSSDANNKSWAIVANWGGAAGSTAAPTMGDGATDYFYANGAQKLTNWVQSRVLSILSFTNCTQDIAINLLTTNGGGAGPMTFRNTLNAGGGANSQINVDAASTANITIGQAGGVTGTFGNVVISNILVVTHNGSGILTINQPIVSDTGSPSIGLTKAGSGVLALSGNNTYNGATVINAGNIKITGGSLANTPITFSGAGVLAVKPGSSTTIAIGSTATASAGATLTIGANNTFSMAEGAISTCNLQQGSTFSGSALTINNGANFKFDLGNTAGDQLAVTKTASAPASGTINVTLSAATNATSLQSTPYTLITAGSGSTLNAGANWALTGSTLTVNGTVYNLALNITATAVTVTATAICAVTYNGNGNNGGTAPVDGSSPYNYGSTATVLGAGTLAKTGYTFAGWNTAADGSGTARNPSDTFTVSRDVTLYAQWNIKTYTVTYNGNGNNGGTGTQEIFYTPQSFNALGQLSGYTDGAGVLTTNIYFANSKRLQNVSVKSGTNLLQNLSYTYDTVSNIKSINDAVYSSSASASISNIVYDDLYRVTSLNSAARGIKTYGYNAIGNVLTNQDFGSGLYGYGAKPHAVTSANGVTYTYDACGNMTARGNQTLTYDEQNQLTKVATTNDTVMFGYDDSGARLWRSGTNGYSIWIGGIYEINSGKVLCHVFGGGKRVATFEPQCGGLWSKALGEKNWYLASTKTEAIFNWPFQNGRGQWTMFGGTWAAVLSVCIVLGRKVQMKRYEAGMIFRQSVRWKQAVTLALISAFFWDSTPEALAAPAYGPVFYYYHNDNLGSSNVLTDRTGQMVQHYEYSTFGQASYQNNTSAYQVSNRYTGQVCDDETGLYYYNARYYDPQLGRFIEADTIVPGADSSQNLNRYSYVNNNPINQTDPNGHGFLGGLWTSVSTAFVHSFSRPFSYGTLTGGGPLLVSLSTGLDYSVGQAFGKTAAADFSIALSATLAVAAIVVGAILCCGPGTQAVGAFMIASGVLSLASLGASMSGDDPLSRDFGWAAFGTSLAATACYVYNVCQSPNQGTTNTDTAQTTDAAKDPSQNGAGNHGNAAPITGNQALKTFGQKALTGLANYSGITDRLENWFNVNIWQNLTLIPKLIIGTLGLVAYYFSGANFELPVAHFNFFGTPVQLDFNLAAQSLSNYRIGSIGFKLIFGGQTAPQGQELSPVPAGWQPQWPK